MDYTTATLLLRFQGHVAVKVCSPTLRYDTLIHFVCRKWNFMEGQSIGLTYNMPEVGQCVITEDEDIASMFGLLRKYSVDQVDVNISLNDSSTTSPQELGTSQTSLHQFDLQPRSEVPNVGTQRLPISTSNYPTSKDMLSAGWANLIQGKGQRFVGGAVEFRKALIKYSVEVGFDFVYLKNEPQRVTAECRFKHQSQCEWRIHASRDNSTKHFLIRNINNDHRCDTNVATASKKKFNSKVIVDLIANDIRNMPGISPRDIQSQVHDKFGVEISYYVAWKTTEAGRAHIFGDHTQSYSTLVEYLSELERTNPDSVVDLDIDPIQNNFRRCFFAFGACITGFNHCRPLVMVDGTFLKGKHKGVLLSAIGKDGNEGLFPIAFAIVSEETNDNWRWFLNHFKVAVGTRRKLIFVSDKNPGILNAVKNLFPGCPHGFCYTHLTRNLEGKFGGYERTNRGEVLNLFTHCAYARTRAEFDELYSRLKVAGGIKISRFLKDNPKEHWSNAYFPGRRYDQMTSNGAESWNSQIRNERGVPITKFIDSLRVLLMNQMRNRRQMATEWNTVLCKDVDAQMKAHINSGRTWQARPSNEHVWEVYSTPNAVVDLRETTCSCREWQIKGIPCVHAAVVIFIKLRGAYEYIDHYYHTSSYLQSYAESIIPFVQPSFDPEGNIVGPPEYQPQRGRPKRKRIQSTGEVTHKRTKCGRCKELGHNRQSCTRPPK